MASISRAWARNSYVFPQKINIFAYIIKFHRLTEGKFEPSKGLKSNVLSKKMKIVNGGLMREAKKQKPRCEKWDELTTEQHHSSPCD
jgi:hypothetical protein